ncbi:murein DD-endopeptidase MepM/ murein hydrolase activator NlpD [Flavobacterium sp. 28A]|uniref:peptidoglycan DD-metalloendopeptidase family protein n=1 Tax=Flavobacterium sp. 28A TaxID=2735895 RepID=UPI00156FF2A0|nr:peptidoglycan DD-metalloendopeptidase family protein [Flavobacterium sp. 28A]NRT14653.1 murein DD-endopeptidase MepM/ murein hydrolase activator NlpD [Flavobacterium sp. 28A]
MTIFETILHNTLDVAVIPESISENNYTPLDLSVTNKSLENESLGNATDFENYIEKQLATNHAKVAYGGYNEERNIYKRSTIFKDEQTEERNMHIGLDLWIKAGTPILAALEGTVHSFQYNSGFGDYGPTIILKHQSQEHIFYTLYGHLSMESLEGLSVGVNFKKGEQIATLGAAVVNGDYASHLHFQVIHDIQKYSGDYPGVCSKKELAYYLDNCPDPNILLKIKAK